MSTFQNDKQYKILTRLNLSLTRDPRLMECLLKGQLGGTPAAPGPRVRGPHGSPRTRLCLERGGGMD